MKAVIPEFKYQSLAHDWQFMYFDKSRTVKWRPHSNLCDPEWLAADLLGHTVDTLKADLFAKRHEQMRTDEQWVSDGLQYQVDYVLDSEVRIGAAQEAFITVYPLECRIFKCATTMAS